MYYFARTWGWHVLGLAVIVFLTIRAGIYYDFQKRGELATYEPVWLVIAVVALLALGLYNLDLQFRCWRVEKKLDALLERFEIDTVGFAEKEAAKLLAAGKRFEAEVLYKHLTQRFNAAEWQAVKTRLQRPAEPVAAADGGRDTGS
jgi:hypothetical protein